MIINIEKPKPVTGMIATTKKTTTVLDTSTLNETQQTEIEELVRDSGFFNVTKSIVNPNAADYNSFRITIKNKDKEHSVIVSNFSTNDNLVKLINRVNEYGKGNRNR